jgi:hypothetical protein
MCDTVVGLDKGHATVFDNGRHGIAAYRKSGGEP